jgi:hypothetical protein
MRNARVVTRRALVAIEEHGPLPGPGDVVGRLAVVVAGLGHALGTGGDVAARREALRAIAADLQPEVYSGWRSQSLVVLLRSLVVDLFEITGLDYEAAKGELVGADARP